MLVIAHRGASGHAPENTRASFRLALEMGAKAIEFDVHQTLDHELVVGHDDDLKRCGGDRRLMKNLHWEGEAEKVDARNATNGHDDQKSSAAASAATDDPDRRHIHGELAQLRTSMTGGAHATSRGHLAAENIEECARDRVPIQRSVPDRALRTRHSASLRDGAVRQPGR